MSGAGGSVVNAAPAATFDVERIRRDFPILHQKVNGHDLVYLDNAATTQKPRAVIDAVTRYYLEDNANIHRGVHELSQRATEAYEKARVKVQRHINAADAREVIYCRGTTEAINMVAGSLARELESGDEIVVSNLEHHSNIVPWQMLCEDRGVKLRVIPINDAGEVVLDELGSLLNPRTKLVSVAHVSNALGTINPVQEIIRMSHDRGVPVLLDGAQSVQHLTVDVRALDCDFFAFSGHKMYAPTGIGILYGKLDWLERLSPYQGGGEMIRTVSFEEGTTYNDLPHRFEAGTPHIEGAIGLGAAVDYLHSVGLERIVEYEHSLLEYATEKLSAIPGLEIIGTAARKSSVVSFVLQGVHPHDIGTILDQEGIAIRTGHHCAQPVMDRFQVPATSRVSLAFYNTRDEIDATAAAIRAVQKVFS